MKNHKLLNLAFIFSLLIFNSFFWKENLGINLLIFSFLMIAVLLLNYKEAFTSTNVRITLVGTIITTFMVVFFNSTASKIAQIASFLIMVGFIHESRMRSIFFAGVHMLSSFIHVPGSFYRRQKEALKKLPRVYFILRILKLSLIPLGITFIFFVIYVIANPIFENYADIAIDKFFQFFKNIFESISFARIMFILSGALLISVIYYRHEASVFLQKDLSFPEKLQRIRKLYGKRKPFFSGITGEFVNHPSEPPFKSIALKNQNRRGIILFLLVNILLLVENIIDFKWLWLGFDLPSDGFSLQHYVREGTGALIVSIFLAMGLMLHYFRRNQNFYPGNSMLRILAYVWIFQNLFLCVSVFLRNYHYIDFHGLAYKRIGVVFFLSLTIFGLITLYHKIRKVKSAYYLVRINTWALYFMIVFLSCFNWDVNIAKYNLAHWNKGEIDVDFYMKLSDKSMPVVFENLDKVKEQIAAHNGNKVHWIKYLNYDQFVADLRSKREKFIADYSRHTWLSFNLPDDKAYTILSQPLLSER